MVAQFFILLKGGDLHLKFVLPEKSKNNLIKIANLVKKGFAKWEELPKKTRNIATGVSFVLSGAVLPKLLFLLTISSVFGCRHMYLSGDIEEAAEQVIIVDSRSPDCSCPDPTELGHP